MRKTILFLAALLASSTAFSATAFWTGNSETVTTVTGLVAWNCEYQYGSSTFWRVFQNVCPPYIEVQ